MCLYLVRINIIIMLLCLNSANVIPKLLSVMWYYCSHTTAYIIINRINHNMNASILESRDTYRFQHVISTQGEIL